MKSLSLNTSQLLAVKHKDGPMMVLAGPGSGKTTVITHRVRYLIENHNISPSKILVITFTKAATSDMKKRYELMVGRTSDVLFSTFHSLFFKILRAHTHISLDNVLKEEQRREVLKNISMHMGIDMGDEEEFLQNLISEISLIKNDLIEIDYYNSMVVSTEDFRNIVAKYETFKQKYNKLDFDDMLYKCYELLSNNKQILHIWQDKFKYLMIDEFQDINKAQYSIIKLLSMPLQNLYIVGDDDQSIYRFRGARPEFLLNFPKDFNNVKTTILDVNYRSTNDIIKLCNKVIIENKVRYDKSIKGTNRNGKPPILLRHEDINQEASNIGNKIKKLIKTIDINEICVIYRTNIQSRAFIDAFTNLNISYQVKDEVPLIYEHFISKDICAYLSLALDKTDNFSLERIINKPKRYINKGIISSYKNTNLPLIDALFSSNQLKQWQIKRIEELIFYLNSVKKRNPCDAFKYIRKAVGYDDYIIEYANFKKINPKGLFEVLEELQESSKSFETLENYINHVNNVIKDSKDNIKDKDFKGVTLSTMHGVKGLEFRVVFVVSCVEGVIPHEKSKTPLEIEEERRLFYVAMTRPKDLLYISTLNTRYEDKVKVTRFLKGLVNII